MSIRRDSGGRASLRPSRPRADGVAVALLALIAAASIGLLPVILPLAATIALSAGGALLLVGFATRVLLRGSPAAHAASEPDADAPPAADHGRGRLARALFFLGTATVAQSAWRPALGLTVSETLFIASFACCCFGVLRGRSVARLPASLIAGVVIFTVGGATSSIDAVSPTQSGAEVLHGVYVMLLWAWTGAMVLNSRRDLLIALTAWGLSTGLNGVGALSQVVGVKVIAGPLEGSRATGFTEHPNDLGGAAAVALIPCLMLATRASFRPGQLVLRWLTVALVAAGLVASGSVAGMAAALFAGLVWLSSPAVRGLGRVSVIAGVAIALLVSTVIGGQIASPGERLAQVTGRPGSTPQSGSGSTRLAVIEAALPRIREDPFVGTGLGPADLAVQVISGGVVQGEQIHGAPWAAWYEAGILGFLGILIVFAAFTAAGWRASGAANSDDDQVIGWALVAAFAAFAVYALSAPLYFQQFGWLAAVVLVAWWARNTRTARVGRDQPQQSERGPSPVLIPPSPTW